MSGKNIPTVLVIFGATGDLMKKKIAPALFNLYCKDKLPKMFRLIGVARRNLSHEDFQTHLIEILKKSPDFKKHKDKAARFLTMCSYEQGRFEELPDYKDLAGVMGRIDGDWNVCANKLFYLAVPPQYYEIIFKHLHKSGLTLPCGPDEGWTRVLVEKPFGSDANTAQKLDMLLAKLFKEEQIYRIDHYLAKEMLQNILSFRFSNNLLEQSWSNKYIEKIDIRLLEQLGAEGRGVFYDGVGALRDVGQNHLLQMLALITMEHPRSFTADAVRARRGDIFTKLVKPNLEEVRTRTYRAQYEGYRSVDGVKKNSQTETYFRVRAFLDSARWQGVPVFMESGKRLKSQIKEIVVTFKHSTPCLCPPDAKGHYKDTVTFSLEPKEGITIQFLSKKPGLDMQVEKRELEFTYRKRTATTQYVEEYEKLLLDCIFGNQILFLNTAEVKSMWEYVDPIVRAWNNGAVPLSSYKPDTDEVTKIAKRATSFQNKISRVMKKQVGMVGLGKMGANAARQLIDKGWNVVGWNRTQSVTDELAAAGMTGSTSLKELVEKLAAPRVLWLMLPAGAATDEIIDQLAPLLDKNDIVIDAANAHYKDTIRRHKALEKKKIRFFDVGFSGGPGGARHGACLMVGGTRPLYDYITPLLIDLAVPEGVRFFEGVGAGHFVKMVHNGIEYGMMQALGEGFDILRHSPFDLRLRHVAEVYNHGSVIESRLVDWIENAYRIYGDDLKDISTSVGSGGGGAGVRIPGEADWTVDTAKELGISAPIIQGAIDARIRSAKKPGYQGKVVNALRNQFGGHKAK